MTHFLPVNAKGLIFYQSMLNDSFLPVKAKEFIFNQ